MLCRFGWIDEIRPVEHRLDGDAGRQRGRDLPQPLADGVRHGATVLARQHQGGADDDLVPVLLSRSEADRLAELDLRHIRHPNDQPVAIGDRCGCEVLEGGNPSVGPDDEGLAAAGHVARASHRVGVLHGLDEARKTSDRTLVLVAGSPIASGPTSEVLVDSVVTRAFGVRLVEGGALGFALPKEGGGA